MKRKKQKRGGIKLGISNQELAIRSKTNLFGKAVLEKEHLEEIQNYIKNLEADNKRLSDSNERLANKAEKLAYENLDLTLDKERLSEEIKGLAHTLEILDLKEEEKLGLLLLEVNNKQLKKENDGLKVFVNTVKKNYPEFFQSIYKDIENKGRNSEQLSKSNEPVVKSMEMEELEI